MLQHDSLPAVMSQIPPAIVLLLTLLSVDEISRANADATSTVLNEPQSTKTAC